MRSRDHDAEIGAQRPGQHRHRRRRHRADHDDVHANRHKPGRQRRFQHVAGKTRVLAHDNPMATITARELLTGSHADPQRRCRRHGLQVGGSPNAVGAEQLAVHSRSLILVGGARCGSPGIPSACFLDQAGPGIKMAFKYLPSGRP